MEVDHGFKWNSQANIYSAIVAGQNVQVISDDVGYTARVIDGRNAGKSRKCRTLINAMHAAYNMAEARN